MMSKDGTSNVKEVERTPEVSWTCPRCSLKNKIDAEHCDACLFPYDEPGFNEAHPPNGNSKNEVTNKIKDFINDAKSKITQFINDPSAALSYIPANLSPSQRPESRDISREGSPSNHETDYFDTTSISSLETNRIDVQLGETSKPPKLKRQTSLRSMQIWENQKAEALEKEQEIRMFCQQCNTNFVDDSFPPNNKSLKFNGTPHSKATKWSRPKDLYESKKSKHWEIFRNPRPTDIIQGTLGNCWFLSALAVVCERQEILRKIMLTTEVNEEGMYQVRLCQDGRWTVVMVDDYLPCNRDNRLVFSQAARQQLWVPIIEKAAAKLVGCYEGLIAGRCIEGLQMLTGSPCESIMLHNKTEDSSEEQIDKDLVWVKLLSCRNAGYLMGASCGGDITDDSTIDSYHMVGLEAQHAYSVLDVQQVDEHRLIRLRNPWGRYSWTGRWSHNSFMWTDRLRGQLSCYDSDDGVFWISLEDMMQYFDCVDVCKYQPEWSEVTLEGSFGCPGHNGEVCHITVFAATELNITLFQKSHRGSRDLSKDSTLDLFIGVYRCTAGTTQPRPVSYIAHSERKVKPSVYCNLFLETGVYLLVPAAFNHWNSGVTLKEPPKYILSIHSSKPVLTDHIPMTKYTYSDALFYLVEKLGKTHDGISGVTCYYLSRKMSGLIVAAENRRSDVHLHVDCDCSNSFNLVSTRGAMHTIDCLPPLSRQILQVLTQLEGGDGYSVSHTLRFRISPLNAYNQRGSHQEPLLTNGLSEIHNPISL